MYPKPGKLKIDTWRYPKEMMQPAKGYRNICNLYSFEKKMAMSFVMSFLGISFQNHDSGHDVFGEVQVALSSNRNPWMVMGS